MLTTDQIQLLADIQALAASGRAQTGCYIKHEVDFLAHGATLSCVKLKRDGHLVHISGATVSADGSEVAAEGPPEFVGENECTLAQQRDRLAAWIAEHRIDKEAA